MMGMIGSVELEAIVDTDLNISQALLILVRLGI
jgi:hypothetical protein